MPHNAAFHRGLHCSLRIKLIFIEKIQYFWGKIVACDPSLDTMDHPDITVSNFMGNSIGFKRVKLQKKHGHTGWFRYIFHKYISYYLNIDFFGRANCKIIDKEQTKKKPRNNLYNNSHVSCKCHQKSGVENS